MSKIAFFCIPAHGHTNPTLEVVKKFIHQGHEVMQGSLKDLFKILIQMGKACNNQSTKNKQP